MQRLIDVCATGQRARRPGGGVREETIVRAAIEGGLRVAKIAALKWPDVRFDQLRLIVRRAIHYDETTGKVEKLPKGNRVERVAISDEFAERLALLYQVSVIEDETPPRATSGPARDRGLGRSIRPRSPSDRRLGRAAGLIDAQGRHIAHLHACGTRRLDGPGQRRVAAGGPGQLRHRGRTSTRAPTCTCWATRSSTASPTPTGPETPTERLERLQNGLAEHAPADALAER